MQRNASNNQGFTLIEMMIVIAIIGILLAVAVPSYLEHVQSAKRTDAQAALLTIMQQQERYFAENRTYTNDLTDLGYASSGAVPSDEGYYTIGAAACSGSTIAVCVILTATGDASTDGNLTFDSLGNKLPATHW